ncbi:MAG: flippase-like domain-containing protein [Thermoplasmata archaeon]|nr:MAG: flippase-like domain-containing protein [Thermoplasmata archaeon]
MEKKQSFWKKKRSYFIFIAIAVLIILIYWANPRSVYDEMKEANKGLIVIAFMMNLTTTLLMLVRWMILYKEVSPGLSGLDSSKVYMIGQATNQVAPMGTGEITRAYVGWKYFDIHFSKTLVSAVIERMVDILFFLILAMICFTIFLPGSRFYLQLIIFVLLSSIGFIFVMRPHTMDRLFIRLEKTFENRGKFWDKISTKLISSWETFKKSMYKYHERKMILLATGILTVIIWSLDAVTQFILFQAFDVEISYFYVLGIVSASFIIGALSFLPGGLGAREGSFAYLAALILIGIGSLSYGEAKALGMAVALVYKSIVYIIIGLGAMIAIMTLPTAIEKKESESEAEVKAESEPKS